jgi:hypothetical protein
MDSKTTTLIEALRCLAKSAETDDCVLQAALYEAASRMQEMREYIAKDDPCDDDLGKWERLTS